MVVAGYVVVAVAESLTASGRRLHLFYIKRMFELKEDRRRPPPVNDSATVTTTYPATTNQMPQESKSRMQIPTLIYFVNKSEKIDIPVKASQTASKNDAFC